MKNLVAKACRRLGYTVVRNEVFRQLTALREASVSVSAGNNSASAPSSNAIAVEVEPVSNGQMRQDLPPPYLPVFEQSLSADHFYELGATALREGNEDEAFALFARANSLILRHVPSRDALLEMSTRSFEAAQRESDRNKSLSLLVRALEMNPTNGEIRRVLNNHTRNYAHDDLTKMCFVFYDSERARAIHTEAYKRALEFVTIGGIPGDVLEFGVLGGWSSRIFCEVMRDIFNLSNIYLYDSFDGLPEYESQIDLQSYEIAGRKVWSDRMRFPADFLARFDQPHHLHIREKLAEVIRPERIVVQKGFYADTLVTPPRTKASIVHLDCDLYQSTVEVFEGLNRGDVFQDGTVLLFDDWNCNRGHPNYGQKRALREFLENQDGYSATPWFTYGFNGAAYIMHDNNV